MREVTHESLPDFLDDTGQSRRSTRVRSQPEAYLSLHGEDETAPRCGSCLKTLALLLDMLRSAQIRHAAWRVKPAVAPAVHRQSH